MPIRVLLIEDNTADAVLVREYLKEAGPGGFELTRAKRMSEALEKLRDERFDVILLDLTLPDCTGLESFERLGKPARRTPVIVLTGVEDTALEKQLMAQGAHDYVRKRHLEGKLLAAILINAAHRA